MGRVSGMEISSPPKISPGPIGPREARLFSSGLIFEGEEISIPETRPFSETLYFNNPAAQIAVI